jgi:hypothetical protein
MATNEQTNGGGLVSRFQTKKLFLFNDVYMFAQTLYGSGSQPFSARGTLIWKRKFGSTTRCARSKEYCFKIISKVF